MPLGAANYISGKSGFVTIGGAEYRFGKWRIPMKTKLATVTNFSSGGFQEMLAAITGATITLEGPYDSGNMPLTSGTSYTFVLAWNSVVSLTCTAIVESLEPSLDVEDAGRVTVTAQSTGTFTAAIT